MTKAVELELESKEFGFYWENIGQIIEQITSECHEIIEANKANDRSHLQEEIGDLLHAAISLTVYCGFDPYETLDKSVSKFEKRYLSVVEKAKSDGRATLKGESFETLMAYWKAAKTK